MTQRLQYRFNPGRVRRRFLRREAIVLNCNFDVLIMVENVINRYEVGSIGNRSLLPKG